MFKKLRLTIIIVILVLAVVFIPGNSLKPVKNSVYKALGPISLASNFLARNIYSFFNTFFHLASMGQRNEDLIKENLDLQSQLSILKEAQHENEILKKELGFISKQENYKLVPASIVGKSVSGFLKSIVIDRGKADNVKVGQAVVSQGFLVGTIKEVYETSSEVNLINNYSSLVPVILQDSRGTGLLRGGIAGLAVEDIPLNISIVSKEQVVTSGLGAEIPAGITIGTVEEVVSKKSEIFQKVTVDSPLEIYLLEYVFVVQQ